MPRADLAPDAYKAMVVHPPCSSLLLPSTPPRHHTVGGQGKEHHIPRGCRVQEVQDVQEVQQVRASRAAGSGLTISLHTRLASAASASALFPPPLCSSWPPPPPAAYTACTLTWAAFCPDMASHLVSSPKIHLSLASNAPAISLRQPTTSHRVYITYA